MTLLRSRPATALVELLPCVDDLVAVERPDEPMHCLRPAAIAAASRAFAQGFPGSTMYAVKCNPHPTVLRAVWDGGVRHFDCASLPEVELVRGLFPDAIIHFMHPVKTRRAIRTAWEQHGVRDFAFDSADELDKILQQTDGTAPLGLIVRVALPKGRAAYDLSGKFGASEDDATALLQAARPFAARLGITFHVGSQSLDPLAWRSALALAGRVARAAGVVVDVLDVGGGFPALYPGDELQPLSAFFAVIEAGVEGAGLANAELWAEPGRALVADGTSVVVQVQARREGALFINDGIYGSLSDAGTPGFRYPTRLMRASSETTQKFSFFGPTCDSVDRMEGPFLLPADVREGDWIEIGQLGAYGACLRTTFNGFDRARMVEVRDTPLLP